MNRLIRMDGLKVIGIQTQTSNQNGESVKDLSQLWENFYIQQIAAKVENKINNSIYGIYTDYESDYNGKYTAFIGVAVDTLDSIPSGLIGREFPPQTFKKYTAIGAIPEAVVKVWQQIWAQDAEFKRSYSYDFELYTEENQQGESNEVDIMVAIN